MWRNASLFPTVLGIDMRAYAGFAVFLFYMSWYTFILSIVLFGFFALLTFFKLPLPKLMGKIKSKLVGKVCWARPWYYHRYFVGTGKLQ